MADQYDHLTLDGLVKAMKRRDLQIKKGQMKQVLIKALWDDDQVQGTSLPASEWG